MSKQVNLSNNLFDAIVKSVNKNKQQIVAQNPQVDFNQFLDTSKPAVRQIDTVSKAINQYKQTNNIHNSIRNHNRGFANWKVNRVLDQFPPGSVNIPQLPQQPTIKRGFIPKIKHYFGLFKNKIARFFGRGRRVNKSKKRLNNKRHYAFKKSSKRS